MDKENFDYAAHKVLEDDGTEARLRARAAPMCARAIGKQMTVRLAKHSKVTGEIVEASFGRFHYTGRSVQVVLKSNATGSRIVVHVRSLPC